MTWEFILLASTLALICFRIKSTFKNERKNWLPGPRHLPVIGGGLTVVALAAKRSFNDTFTKMTSKYGSFNGTFVFNTYFVTVSDPNIAKTVLGSEKFSSRMAPDCWSSKLYDGGPNLGVLHSYGNTSKIVRDLIITKLKVYGTGRVHWMDSIVQEQVKLCLKDVGRKISGGRADISLKGIFTIPIVNVVTQILSGEIFEEKKLQELISLAENIFCDRPKSVGILFALSFLRFIPRVTVFDQARYIWQESKKIFQDIIKRKRSKGDYKQKPTDVIDSFLRDQENGTNALTDDQIIWICLDIFVGTITALPATHLEWAILFITSNPHTYQTVMEEIDSVIKPGNIPKSQDKSRMPYVEATLLETLRLGSVVNYGMRCPLEDVEIDGYHIPKKCQVMIENASLKMDPNIWETPESFRPERFLNNDMEVINKEKLKSFGIRRTCPGEPITKYTSFLFFTSLLQHYTIKRSPKSSNVSFKPASGILGRPQPYFVLMDPKIKSDF